MLGCGVVVCGLDEGDDEIFDRGQELVGLSVVLMPGIYLKSRLTSSTSPARCSPWLRPFAGLDGIDEPFVAIVRFN